MFVSLDDYIKKFLINEAIRADFSQKRRWYEIEHKQEQVPSLETASEQIYMILVSEYLPKGKLSQYYQCACVLWSLVSGLSLLLGSGLWSGLWKWSV